MRGAVLVGAKTMIIIDRVMRSGMANEKKRLTSTGDFRLESKNKNLVLVVLPGLFKSASQVASSADKGTDLFPLWRVSRGRCAELSDGCSAG